MKKLLSTLMIATVLGSATYTPKSEAGITIAYWGAFETWDWAATHSDYQNQCKTPSGKDCRAAMIAGWTSVAGLGLGMITGGTVLIVATGMAGAAFFGGLIITLAEDGAVPQDQLENALAQKYDFIADREVISTLAQTIAEKSLSVEANAEGMKMVSLSEDEVKSILSATELTEEEIAQVVKDLGPVATAAAEVADEEKVNGMTFLPQAK